MVSKLLPQTSQSGKWQHCADEGQICLCLGEVRFGLEMRKNASEENVQWASETLLAKNGLVFCTEDGALNRMQWCEYVVCSGFSHCVKLVVFFSCTTILFASNWRRLLAVSWCQTAPKCSECVNVTPYLLEDHGPWWCPATRRG